MSKLTDLSSSIVTVADGDLMHMVDVSDTTSTPQGTSKKLPFSILRKGVGNIYYAELSIPTAQVLTLNTTPLEIVAAPGTGYAIEVISASVKGTFNSVAYATNTGLQLFLDTADIAQLQLTGANTFLNFTVTKHSKFVDVTTHGAAITQIIENKSLKIKVATGDPTSGNSGIKVYVFYRIITL